MSDEGVEAILTRLITAQYGSVLSCTIVSLNDVMMKKQTLLSSNTVSYLHLYSLPLSIIYLGNFNSFMGWSWCHWLMFVSICSSCNSQRWCVCFFTLIGFLDNLFLAGCQQAEISASLRYICRSNSESLSGKTITREDPWDGSNYCRDCNNHVMVIPSCQSLLNSLNIVIDMVFMMAKGSSIRSVRT